MPILEGIAPIVPVSNVARSVSFFTNTLGFEIRTQDEDFALVARQGAGVSLIRTTDDKALDATATNISAYIWVNDLMGLWTELEPKLKPLGDARVRAPFVQDYGMREFHVKDPDGFLIFFGEIADKEGAS